MQDVDVLSFFLKFPGITDRFGYDGMDGMDAYVKQNPEPFSTSSIRIHSKGQRLFQFVDLCFDMMKVYRLHFCKSISDRSYLVMLMSPDADAAQGTSIIYLFHRRVLEVFCVSTTSRSCRPAPQAVAGWAKDIYIKSLHRPILYPSAL